MTEKQKSKFRRAAHTAARSIREGSLLVEPVEKWAQVHRSSWEPLAMINELGFITFSSQDALDARNGKVKLYERSFVEGLMLQAEAKEFVEKINMFTDKVAYIMAGKVDPRISMAEEFIWPSIIVTKWSVMDKNGKPTGLWEHGMGLPLDMTTRRINRIKESSGIPAEVPVRILSLVSIFDPKWGRSATSKKGLFTSIIHTLTPGEHKWVPNEFLHQRYLDWKSQDE